MLVIYIFNSICSLILFSLVYYDITTISVFLSSILLCSNKIFQGYSVAKKSLNENIPISYFNREYVLFNCIEKETNDDYDGEKTPPRKSFDIGPFVSIKKVLRTTSMPEII